MCSGILGRHHTSIYYILFIWKNSNSYNKEGSGPLYSYSISIIEKSINPLSLKGQLDGLSDLQINWQITDWILKRRRFSLRLISDSVSTQEN